MSYFTSILKALGGLVDKAVPVAVGSRTKISAVVCPVLSVAGPFVPPQYQPAVVIVQQLLCAATPAFALAGLVRDESK